MKLSASTGVDGDPAVLAIVLEAGYVGAKERSKLACDAKEKKGGRYTLSLVVK